MSSSHCVGWWQIRTASTVEQQPPHPTRPKEFLASGRKALPREQSQNVSFFPSFRQSMNIRDRIVELRRVPACDLRPNPRNWRTHPKAQADALRGVLAEIGFAGAELVRELEDGTLQLIDGHLRAEVSGDAPIPCLILDVTEAEADKLLATFDPLSAMAEVDVVKLDELLHEVQFSSQAVADMLTELAESAAIIPGGDAESPEDFKEVDETIECESECPKCGYRFSGGSSHPQP